MTADRLMQRCSASLRTNCPNSSSKAMVILMP